VIAAVGALAAWLLIDPRLPARAHVHEPAGDIGAPEAAEATAAA
jgi:hypothetical protein